MKKYFLTILALFTTATCTAAYHHVDAQPYAQSKHQQTEVKFASYPSELKPMVQMAMRIPQVRQLLAKVQQEGPVRVEICKNRHDGFQGYWDGATRSIVLDGNMGSSPGEMISTLIFELHNAESNHRFEQLNEQAAHGQIDKETFVKETERIEHNNVLRCSILVNRGIKQGVLPQSARMPAIRNFEAHYKVQQLTGHSQFLARCYDNYAPRRRTLYRGTISNLNRMSARQKDQMLNRLVTDNLEYPS